MKFKYIVLSGLIISLIVILVNLINSINYPQNMTTKISGFPITVNSSLELTKKIADYFDLPLGHVVLYDGIIDASSITPKIVNNPDDYTVLINKFHALPNNYAPNDLVDVNSKIQVREGVANAWRELEVAAKNEGYTLFATSGYRTIEFQKNLYYKYCNSQGMEMCVAYSAYPGRSEHNAGLAIDVTLSVNSTLNDFINTTESHWLANNAHRFGFVVRYKIDNENITNYKAEPWHIRYLGIELANELYEKNITLEEYYDEVYK